MCAIKSVCVCVYLIAWATSSIWLKFCTKTARLSWKSPSRVMVKWSPAMVCVLHACLCMCVSARLLIFCSAMADGSLAEWLTTGWGALWWSCQPCCVAFSWQWLSWHSQKHIRMQLFSHLVWIEFWVEKSPCLPRSFRFHECLGKENGDLHAGIKYVHMHWWTVWERDFRKDECTHSVVLGTLVKELDLLWEKAGFVKSL